MQAAQSELLTTQKTVLNILDNSYQLLTNLDVQHRVIELVEMRFSDLVKPQMTE